MTADADADDRGDGTQAGGCEPGDGVVAGLVADDTGEYRRDATNGRGIVVGDDADAGALNAWSAGATYTAGAVATHDGSVWVATWWTCGQPGASAHGPWETID